MSFPIDLSPSPFAQEQQPPLDKPVRRASIVALLSPPPLSLLPIDPSPEDEPYGLVLSDPESYSSSGSSTSGDSRRGSNDTLKAEKGDSPRKEVDQMKWFNESGSTKSSLDLLPPVVKQRRRSVLALASFRFSPNNKATVTAAAAGGGKEAGKEFSVKASIAKFASAAGAAHVHHLQQAHQAAADVAAAAAALRSPQPQGETTATAGAEPGSISAASRRHSMVEEMDAFARLDARTRARARSRSNSLCTVSDHISLLGTSVADLSKPPEPIDLGPILRLPALNGGNAHGGSTDSAANTHFPAGLAASFGLSTRATVASSTAMLTTTVEAASRLASALVPPNPVAMINQTANFVRGGFQNQSKGSSGSAGRASPAPTDLELASPRTTAFPLSPLSPTEERPDFFSQKQVLTAGGSNGSTPTPTPSLLLPIAPLTPMPPITPPPPPAAVAQPPAETIDCKKRALQEMGWVWGAAAQKVFDRPPDRSRRLSSADIDDDMVCDMERIPSDELDPFVFNADDPELRSWPRFSTAYAGGEIDLDKGVPPKPTRGVPDVEMCPFATPIDCGPFRAPKPLWEPERQRTVRRMAVRHLDSTALREISTNLAEMQAVFGQCSLRFTIIDGDQLIKVTQTGVEEEPEPRDASLCAHTILNRNRGMVVLDTQKDWRFSDVDARFYAGMPVTAANGMPVGCIAVWDAAPWTEFEDKFRRCMRTCAKALGVELEAYLVRRFQEKIQRMNQSFDKLGKSGDDVVCGLKNQACLDAATTMTASKPAKLLRTGSHPAMTHPAVANVPQKPMTDLISLGLLMTERDADLLQHFLHIVRSTLDMSAVYLAGVSMHAPGEAGSHKSYVIAADGAEASHLQLDYVSHVKAAKDVPLDEGLIVQDLDRKAIRQGKGPAKLDDRLFLAGFLIPIRCDSLVNQKTEPSAGFVLGAMSLDPSKALGIEDLRYLQKFAMIFSGLLTRHAQALTAAVEDARKSMLRGTKAKDKYRINGMLATGAQAVMCAPKMMTKGTVAVGRSVPTAFKTVTATTKKTFMLFVDETHAGPPTPGSPSSGGGDVEAPPASPTLSMYRGQSNLFHGRASLSKTPSNVSHPVRPLLSRTQHSSTGESIPKRSKPKLHEYGIAAAFGHNTFLTPPSPTVA